MKNIFILYMPHGNTEAMVHYEDTIKNKVSQERIYKYIDENLRNSLKNIFGVKPIAVWGSRDSEANRNRFDRMKRGDDILIVEGDTIKLLGKVAAKTNNPELSKDLWKNIRGNSSEGWNLIYFIANPKEIDIPFEEFKKLFDYNMNWQLRGFTNVADEKLTSFYDKYDDLYSILERIKLGEEIKEKPEPQVVKDAAVEKYEVRVEDADEIIGNEILSDHIKMQWKLIRMGLKTGAKVWIPRNDQSRIVREFEQVPFEEHFSAGIDTPAEYVENIDVVWKEEFRIDAAFEIENTTSIYSGLLRFSDLKIVAPNSNYPLFIVAPLSKKTRVFKQTKRPTFKELGIDKSVRYLSYEVIDEVDSFFESSSSGLNIDLLLGKSEKIN